VNNLFNENQWFGEFFVPNHYDKRFSGKVDYSPEEGLHLTYNLPKGHCFPVSDILHGNLLSHEKVTLFGKFAFTKNQPMRIPESVPWSGQDFFLFFIIGDFINSDEFLTETNFTLTNMQEFFSPKALKDMVKYSKQPLFEVNTDFGKISLINKGTFGFLPSDVASLFSNNNEDALKALESAFKEVTKKYSPSQFLVKKDIEYRMSIQFNSGILINDLYTYIRDISDLFALLMYKPVYPDEILVSKGNNDTSQKNLFVYLSLRLSKRTISICTDENDWSSMPITAEKINLPLVIANWLKTAHDFWTFLVGFQHGTGLKDINLLSGDLLLFISQLEFISFNERIKTDKYKYPIEKYGCPKIADKLKGIFQRYGEEDIGKGISQIRGEIAHVGKPKELMDKIPIETIMDISYCLQMIILGYILEKIGIPTNLIVRYQEKYTNYVQ
jgi:hypothetical protein